MESSQINEYDCHAYNESLANGKSSGKVKISFDGFIFYIQEQVIRVPFATCKVELGGASDRIVFIRHPQLSEWTFYTSDRSILSDSHLASHTEILPQLNSAKSRRTRGVLATLAVSLIILGIPIFLVLRMDIITGVVAKQIPTEWEDKLGSSTIKQYSLSHDFLDQEQTDILLEPLLAPLLSALLDSPYEYHFYIANDPSLNAFALPGGYVVIHSELILKADNAEELLGVLAHEMMHVEQQHGVRNVIGAAGVYTIVSAFLGDMSGILATAAGAAPLLLNQSYSRGFEKESDVLGFRLLVKAGINPEGLASFFRKVMQQEQEILEKIEDERAREAVKTASRFLSTHPTSNKRIKYLEELAESVSVEGIDLEAEFTALQESVKQFVLETGEESLPLEESTDES